MSNEIQTRHRIDIPNGKPLTDADVVRGDIIIATLRNCGMDPRKAYYNPMATELVKVWVRGEWTDAQFRHAIGNLMILNPGLRIGA